MTNPFTFQYLESQIVSATKLGYKFIRCEDALDRSSSDLARSVIMRVDIDESVDKTNRLLDIFARNLVKATFFVRLHGPYNPFSFANYATLRRVRDEGHEIGYHSEVIDESVIWGEDAEQCLKRDIQVLEAMLDVRIRGVASHGGRTGLNNLDFWKTHSPVDFSLGYEAYDDSDRFGIFSRSLYISDSEWTRWKCYRNGEIVSGDHRSLVEHLEESPPLVYLLIHPETYFGSHVYE